MYVLCDVVCDVLCSVLMYVMYVCDVFIYLTSYTSHFHSRNIFCDEKTYESLTDGYRSRISGASAWSLHTL